MWLHNIQVNEYTNKTHSHHISAFLFHFTFKNLKNVQIVRHVSEVFRLVENTLLVQLSSLILWTFQARDNPQWTRQVELWSRVSTDDLSSLLSVLWRWSELRSKDWYFYTYKANLMIQSTEREGGWLRTFLCWVDDNFNVPCCVPIWRLITVTS